MILSAPLYLDLSVTLLMLEEKHCLYIRTYSYINIWIWSDIEIQAHCTTYSKVPFITKPSIDYEYIIWTDIIYKFIRLGNLVKLILTLLDTCPVAYILCIRECIYRIYYISVEWFSINRRLYLLRFIVEENSSDFMCCHIT